MEGREVDLDCQMDRGFFLTMILMMRNRLFFYSFCESL